MAKKKSVPSTKFPDDVLQALADHIRESIAKSDNGKSKRSEVIKWFNRTYADRKYRLTVGKLAALYRSHGKDKRGGSQDDFLKAYPPTPAKKVEVKMVGPMAKPPRTAIERPPRPAKKPAEAFTPPALEPVPESQELSGPAEVPIHEEIVHESETLQEDPPLAAAPPVPPEPKPPAMSGKETRTTKPDIFVPEYLSPRQKRLEDGPERPVKSLDRSGFTEAMLDDVALLLGQWQIDKNRNNPAPRLPAAFVAMRMNAKRVGSHDPTVSAATINAIVGRGEREIKKFLLNRKVFQDAHREDASDLARQIAASFQELVTA